MSSACRAAAALGMTLAWAWAWAPALALGSGCTTTLDETLDSAPTPGGGGGSGPAGSTATSIAFRDAALVLVPADLRPVDIVVAPPGVHRVRFTLLGDSKDAFLDHGQIDTAEDGTATVRLRAPSTASTFVVRASVGDLYAEITASQSSGVTQVDVKPRYTGGRNVESWVATIRTGTDCRAEPGRPPPDGPLRGESAAAGPVRVSGVPLGTSLTVILRSEQFAWGCEELPEGFDGVAAQVPEVVVPITDRPLRLEGASLPLWLGVDTTADLISAWGALSTRMASAAMAGASADSVALLDAMSGATPPSERAAFETARSARGWDALAAAAIPREGKDDRVRTAIARRVVSGLTPLAAVGFSGALSTREDAGTEGQLVLDRIGGLPAEDVGVSASVDLTLTAEPLDRLLFGGQATLEPSHFAAALGGAEAERESGLDSVAEALSVDVGCQALSLALVDAETGLAHAGCDAACLAARCTQALDVLWKRAAAAEALSVTIELAASGNVTRIDGEARPLAFEGTWVGTTTLGPPPTRLSGVASAGSDLRTPP